MVDRDELAVERPEPLPASLGDLDGLRGDAVFLELGLDEREGQLGADQRDVAALAKQVGNTADVVLVPVGQHDRLDLVEAIPDPGEVGQDHVDAGLVLLGEQHAAVDDEQPPGVLEDRHVAPDLTEPAERHDPKAALGQRRRGAELRMRMAHVVSPDFRLWGC